MRTFAALIFVSIIMKRRYLDPKNDIPFKRVFGENPDLFKSFLNAEMPFEENQYIESLEYLPTELVPDNPAKKDSIVDVRCKDNFGRQFIVEMQMYWNTSFSNRMVFNSCKAYPQRKRNKGHVYNTKKDEVVTVNGSLQKTKN
jgi:predicted transposase/invertase (TIGR01784 family)